MPGLTWDDLVGFQGRGATARLLGMGVSCALLGAGSCWSSLSAPFPLDGIPLVIENLPVTAGLGLCPAGIDRISDRCSFSSLLFSGNNLEIPCFQ